MSDREPRKVVVPYANLQKQIRCLLPESGPIKVIHPSFAPLKGLHETLCSMEPMVYDLEQSESLKETRHKDTAEFLSLVKEAKISIGHQFNSNSYTVKNELESIRKRMKNLFRNYVEAELVAELSEVADEQVKMELQRLISYLRSTIRFKLADDTKNWRVLRNIDIVLDNLKQESDERAQLELLNKVKLLLKFLKGDHGINIPNHLLGCEQRLRKHFITEDGLAELKKQEQKDEAKAINESMWFSLIVGAIALAFYIKNQDLFGLLIASCCFLAFCICAYEKFMDGSSSNSTKSSDQNNLKEREKCDTFLKNLTERKTYDIFLNFRGLDVRHNLAGLFYSRFEKENISLFFDESSIPKSEIFWEEIKTGINNSIGAIVIFSRNYATSKDCLNELVLIQQRALKTKEEGGTYKIRPIFYDIPTNDLEPATPPKPESKFHQDLKNHEEGAMLVEWAEAVAHMLTINGDTYDSERQHLYKLIDSVVEDFRDYIQTRGIPK